MFLKKKKEEELPEKEEENSLQEQLEEEKKAREELKARLEASEKERESFRKQNDELAQKYTRESTEKVKYQGNSIESLILAKKADAERLKRDMATAVEAGKFSESSELTADYADLRAEIRELEKQKTQLSEPAPIQKEKTASEVWIEAHPEFNYNEDFKRIALKADSMARRAGIKAESEEYFRFIEETLDKDYYEEEEKPRKIEGTPPSRGESNSKQKTISLTADEVEIAMMTYGHPLPDGTRRSAADAKKMYWEAKQELIKNGQL